MSVQSSTVTTTAPRWPLVVVVVALLPLAVVASAVLSGAGTLALFAGAGFPVQAQPFGLGLVEVLSLAGTLLRIFATGDRLRRDALVAVVVATAVAVIGGASAYGPVGVLAGVFLVGLVHLAAEAWLELRARSTTPPTAVAPVVVSEEKAPEEPSEDELDERPDPVDERRDGDDMVRDLERWGLLDESGQLLPVHGPATLAELVHAADVRPGDRPSERSLAAELEVTRHAVRTTRAQLAGLTVVSA